MKKLHALFALVLSACSTASAKDLPMSRDVQFPIAPWHMWGSQQTLNVPSPAGLSQQLVRVNHKRPETWRFLLWLIVPPIAGGDLVACTWYCITGIGRASVTIPLGIARIQGPTTVPETLWFSTVQQPNFDSTPGVLALPTSTITGQDLQIYAACSAGVGPYSVTVGAQVAPNVHVGYNDDQ